MRSRSKSSSQVWEGLAVLQTPESLRPAYHQEKFKDNRLLNTNFVMGLIMIQATHHQITPELLQAFSADDKISHADIRFFMKTIYPSNHPSFCPSNLICVSCSCVSSQILLHEHDHVSLRPFSELGSVSHLLCEKLLRGTSQELLAPFMKTASNETGSSEIGSKLYKTQIFSYFTHFDRTATSKMSNFLPLKSFIFFEATCTDLVAAGQVWQVWVFFS